MIDKKQQQQKQNKQSKTKQQLKTLLNHHTRNLIYQFWICTCQDKTEGKSYKRGLFNTLRTFNFFLAYMQT